MTRERFPDGGLAGTKVVSLVTNLVPYHHARWEAFAAECPGITLLQIVSGDRFGVLEFAPGARSYATKALFRGSSWDRLPAAEMRRVIRGELNAQAPDIVFLNGYAARFNWIALGWCLENGVPVVICSESNEFDEERKPWKEAVKRFFVSRCAAGLAGGAPQADYLVKLGLPREVVHCGYDAVDNGHFARGAEHARREEAAARARLGLPQRYFFACARFERKKNLPLLIHAYAAYRRRAGESGHPACDLVIAGEGQERSLLEQAVEESGMKGSVHLIGPKGYADLPAYYGLALAFVHASTTEQWGLVVNEAMASGLPVLASRRCGCVRDLVHDGVNGMVFDPENREEIASAMYRLASDPAVRDAMAAESQKIIAEWSPERFAKGAAAAVRHAMESRPRETGIAGRLLLRYMAGR